jgi:hypothetical protein
MKVEAGYGADTLADDALMQFARQVAGDHQGPDDFSLS